jgi:transcriptional regulator with PAS, ATPase and Fis domain
VQVKLLRFLQEKCFQRVGGRQEKQSDARILAATNRNLQEFVASRKFREDLYFRLAVVVVKVPRCGSGGTTSSRYLRLSCISMPSSTPSPV